MTMAQATSSSSGGIDGGSPGKGGDGGIIQAIDRSDVARICSGQVVVDLPTAVKELVENALDAKATHVEVKLKDSGLESIEVSDNGSGIAPKDYEALTLKYHTSKISNFADLSKVSSFGFRGEALSSLCEISGSFEVTTRTANEEMGVRLTYDRKGNLKSKEPLARLQGTSVIILRLFEPLPVRRAEFKRNAAKQYTKLLRALQAYAVVSVGVRFTCLNFKGPKSTRQLVLSTQNNPSLRENIVNIFGATFFSGLTPLDIQLKPDNSQQEEGEETMRQGGGMTSPASKQGRKDGAKCEQVEQHISGYVSKSGSGVGRSDNDRQFFFLNGRPVDLPRVTRLVNEIWRLYEMKHKPAAILNLETPPGSYDVNVTPDKREVFLVGEAAILDRLKEVLNGLWQPSSSSHVYKVNEAQVGPGKLAVPKAPVLSQINSSRIQKASEDDQEGEAATLPAASVTMQEPQSPISNLEETEAPRMVEGCGNQKESEGANVRMDAVPQEKAMAESLSLSPPPPQQPLPSPSPPESPQRPPSTRKSEADVLRVPDRGDSGGGGPSESKPAAADRSMRGYLLRREPSIADKPSSPVKTIDLSVYRLSSDLDSSSSNRGSPRAHQRQHSNQKSGLRMKKRGRDEDMEEEWDDGTTETFVTKTLVRGLGKDQTGGGSQGLGSKPKGTDPSSPPIVEVVDSSDDDGAKISMEVELEPGSKRKACDKEACCRDDEGEEGPEADEVKRARRSREASPPVTPGGQEGQGVEDSEDDQVEDKDYGLHQQQEEEPSSRHFHFDPAQALAKLHAKATRGQEKEHESSLSSALSLECTMDPEKGGDCEEAARVFSRVLKKEHFTKMVVVGQFNLGFILARLGPDLFILDQHACDEKYNFERLQETTTIHEQRLICPLPLEVSAMEEAVIMEHLDVFRRNGFHFQVEEEADPMQRLKIVALPMSKSTTFGVNDIHELASLLTDQPSPTTRLPKIRAMFASRACRMSIMIGKPLTRPQMLKVIRNLAAIEQPWNCPHGRPTMRHLVDLGKASPATSRIVF